jgi:uncharacterized protein (DUF302 family)
VTDYGYSVVVGDGYDEAVVRARLALRAEGFSIITEMHVGGLLGAEAGSDRQYLIMGAWGPAGSAEELQDDLEVAMHLPCNLVVQESDTGAIVAALDPADGIASDMPGSERVAMQAHAALGRVLGRIGQA